MKLNNETKGTALKKFNIDTNNGGIVKAVLESVKVDTVEYGADVKIETFRSKTVPRISFVFTSVGDPQGVKPSYYIHSYTAVEHTSDNVLNKSWKTEAIAAYIKHFHEALTERPLTEEEIKLAAFDLEEIDKNGSFVEHDVDTVIAAWQKFFNGVGVIFNGSGKNPKPLYKNDKGEAIILNMKLILSNNNGLVNNGDPGMPLFPGQGVIEKYVPQVKPSIKVEIAKGESITPVAPVKRTAPGAMGAPTGANVSADDIPDYLRGGSNMPF
jgi:hypothetical protein